MTTKEWFNAGSTPRGNPAARRARPRRPAILLLLALLSLGETGCQSGFFGPCGSCRNGLRGISERVFRPFRRATAVTQPCCGGEVPLGVESPGMIQYGTPTVVAPAPITTVPGATLSTPAPSNLEPIPSNLEPIPSAAPGPPPDANGTSAAPRDGAKTSAGRTNYEASRPRFPTTEPVRSSRLDSSKYSGPEPTQRSAQGPARSGAVDETSPLDNLPPLDIPKDFSRADAGGVGDLALAGRQPTAIPEPAPTVEVGRTDFEGHAGSAPPLTVAPGLRRFAGVAPKLAGGSVPGAGGLEWLAEKGYKTILDLREENEISPTFISDVARLGMRYVALPITLATVDEDHLKRFRFEIGLADSRPLYFFDTDGNRAGTLWYVQRITADGVDSEVARRDAEELGLTDPRFRAAASAFLEGRKPAPAASPAAAAPAPDPGRAPAPAPDPKSGEGDTPKPAGGPSAGSPPAPQPATDATAWRALIPMFVTILGLPAAYLSRSAVPSGILGRVARASLPGSGHSQRSLPSRSDV